MLQYHMRAEDEENQTIGGGCQTRRCLTYSNQIALTTRSVRAFVTSQHQVVRCDNKSTSNLALVYFFAPYHKILRAAFIRRGEKKKRYRD